MILTTKCIDDLCLKYFVEAGAIAVRRVLPADIKRIARATGGEVVTTMSDMVRLQYISIYIMIYVYVVHVVCMCYDNNLYIILHIVLYNIRLNVVSIRIYLF